VTGEPAAGGGLPSAEALAALAGHRFPGGSFRLEHWESWLITDCTGREPLPDGLAHPIVLFHAPLLGARTSIAELFALAGATGLSGSVALLGYDWEYHQPLREGVDYRAEGGIVRAERRVGASGAVDDDLTFSIELTTGGAPAARVTNRWRFRRAAGGPTPAPPPVPGPGGAPALAVSEGVEIPPWEMPAVDPARMKTMAAVLRDPYPVHWDRDANAAIGLPGRVVNQGPLNLGYIANMLMAWAGPASVRRLTVSFGRPVLDGDRVVAQGWIREVTGGVARCDVALLRNDEPVVTGTAEVVAPS
jgi:acyl dehydratase